VTAYRDLIDPPSGPCPRCVDTPLYPLSHGAARVFRCKACGGVLADRQTLQRFASGDRADLRALADEATRAPPRPPTVAGAVECPWCGHTMRSVLIPAARCWIDVCPAHGAWFDRWEVQIVADAVRDPEAATACVWCCSDEERSSSRSTWQRCEGVKCADQMTGGRRGWRQCTEQQSSR
jgi:Zn-finger nucleic acid-binding protein